MKPIHLLACIGPMLFALACDRGASNFERGDTIAMEAEYLSAPLEMRLPEPPKLVDNSKLIKTADLELTVENLDSIRKAIAQVVTGFDAYMVSDKQYNSSERLISHQVIRVPVQKFDGLLARIESLGAKVDDRTVEVTDVTAEFVDTQARIKAKRMLEARYYDILGKATKVQDMLSIEQELNKVRTEIERMEGRINFLTNQVAFSTIAVQCSQQLKLVSDFGFGQKFVQSVAQGWDVLLRFILGIATLWPLLVGVGVVVYFIRRRSSLFVRKIDSSDMPS